MVLSISAVDGVSYFDATDVFYKDHVTTKEHKEIHEQLVQTPGLKSATIKNKKDRTPLSNSQTLTINMPYRDGFVELRHLNENVSVIFFIKECSLPSKDAVRYACYLSVTDLNVMYKILQIHIRR